MMTPEKIADLRLLLSSGNAIPVDRVTLKAEDLKELLDAYEPVVEYKPDDMCLCWHVYAAHSEPDGSCIMACECEGFRFDHHYDGPCTPFAYSEFKRLYPNHYKELKLRKMMGLK